MTLASWGAWGSINSSAFSGGLRDIQAGVGADRAAGPDKMFLMSARWGKFGGCQVIGSHGRRSPSAR